VSVLFEIINLLIIGTSWATAFIALRAYMQASFNKIDSLHWGVSFLSTGLIFVIYFVVEITQPLRYQSLSILVHFLETYVLLTQLFIAIRLLQAAKKRSNTVIRFTRVGAEIFKGSVMAILFLFMIRNMNYFYVPFRSNLALFDIKTGDYILEFSHLILAVSISIIIPALSYYKLVKIGFLLIGMKELIQLANLHAYLYMNDFLITIEWSFFIIGLMAVFFGILAIDKTTKEHNHRIVDRRTEETDVNHIKKIEENKNESIC